MTQPSNEVPAFEPAAPPQSAPWWRPAEAPRVALLFHRALGAVFLVAWVSLGSQILVLVGSRGLLPLADFVTAAREAGTLSFATFPSLLAWAPGDDLLFWGTVGGAALSLVQMWGVRPRVCSALQTVWYLGYVTACRGFLGFQWDNLLLECGLLAAFLPTRPTLPTLPTAVAVAARAAVPVALLLFRALLFKLYFESGLAKWQSPLHDWRDGSAMTFYYQTAPLPTALAWYAHHLPRWWHLFESWSTLAIELILPLAIFGPRRARHLAFWLFTAFQLVNAATANYGFFCYLTGALHLFLLDDADLASVWRTRIPPPPANAAPPPVVRPTPSRAGRAVAYGAAATWLLVSMTVAWFHFGEPGPRGAVLVPLLEWSQRLRVVNAFHLFAAVTRNRIEPEIQIQGTAGGPWTAYHLRYKPGQLNSPPRFVAPHQPRLDFYLWFYGLGFQRRPPTYVSELLARLCEDPSAVASLFPATLPPAPFAVRIVFWDYRFTSAAEKKAHGTWWNRDELGTGHPLVCGPPASSPPSSSD